MANRQNRLGEACQKVQGPAEGKGSVDIRYWDEATVQFDACEMKKSMESKPVARISYFIHLCFFKWCVVVSETLLPVHCNS